MTYLSTRMLLIFCAILLAVFSVVYYYLQYHTNEPKLSVYSQPGKTLLINFFLLLFSNLLLHTTSYLFKAGSFLSPRLTYSRQIIFNKPIHLCWFIFSIHSGKWYCLKVLGMFGMIRLRHTLSAFSEYSSYLFCSSIRTLLH